MKIKHNYLFQSWKMLAAHGIELELTSSHDCKMHATWKWYPKCVQRACEKAVFNSFCEFSVNFFFRRIKVRVLTVAGSMMRTQTDWLQLTEKPSTQTLNRWYQNGPYSRTFPPEPCVQCYRSTNNHARECICEWTEQIVKRGNVVKRRDHNTY